MDETAQKKHLTTKWILQFRRQTFWAYCMVQFSALRTFFDQSQG